MADNRIEKLLQLLNNNRTDTQHVQKNITDSLSKEQRAMFDKAMNDQDFAQRLLQSEQAKQLLEKLARGGGKVGSE